MVTETYLHQKTTTWHPLKNKEGNGKCTVVPNPGSWQAEWRPKNNPPPQNNHQLLNQFPKIPSPSELLPANAPNLRMLHHPLKLPYIGNWTLDPQNCETCKLQNLSHELEKTISIWTWAPLWIVISSFLFLFFCRFSDESVLRNRQVTR